MELWIATGNKGKLSEFKSLLHDLHLQIHSQNELKNYFSPQETGTTFEENARIKAKTLKTRIQDKWVLAEDSGLEVSALNHMPGIHSARYAGNNARDEENVAKLLKMLKIRAPQQREAMFKATLVAISPKGEEHVFSSEFEGKISEKVRPGQGFGYDVCFIPNGEDKTLSELGVAYKNKHSHRALVIRQFKDFLMNQL